MSYFGDNTAKQRLLETIETEEDCNYSSAPLQLIYDLMDIVKKKIEDYSYAKQESLDTYL